MFIKKLEQERSMLTECVLSFKMFATYKILTSRRKYVSVVKQLLSDITRFFDRHCPMSSSNTQVCFIQFIEVLQSGTEKLALDFHSSIIGATLGFKETFKNQHAYTLVSKTFIESCQLQKLIQRTLNLLASIFHPTFFTLRSIT